MFLSAVTLMKYAESILLCALMEYEYVSIKVLSSFIFSAQAPTWVSAPKMNVVANTV